MVLPGRTYVVGREAMRELQQSGVQFLALSGDLSVPKLEKVAPGERV
jgi:hypothetical protein